MRGCSCNCILSALIHCCSCVVVPPGFLFVLHSHHSLSPAVVVVSVLVSATCVRSSTSAEPGACECFPCFVNRAICPATFLHLSFNASSVCIWMVMMFVSSVSCGVLRYSCTSRHALPPFLSVLHSYRSSPEM